MRRIVERLWHDRPSPTLRVLSACLAPAEWAYYLGIGLRNWGHARGLLRSRPGALPTVAIGNLTVGGTGKTPVTAWIARELAELGRAPAVVMRGYGGDEDAVHRTLNPSVPVIVSADRVIGIAQAKRIGADVVVLDDAFQHRALRADVYIALLAAEEWTDRIRLLPRGPWREPLAALRRAQLLAVTRKIAAPAAAAQVGEALARRFPTKPRARAYIAVSRLARFAAGELDVLPAARGFRASLAVAGVARPEAVWKQLSELGVNSERQRAFPDHHRFGARDVREIEAAGRAGPVVATLKDAVKLRPLLSDEIDIYIPLQEVIWEEGGAEVQRLVADAVTTREVHREASP